MPQYPFGVFNNTYVSCDIGFFILYKGRFMSIPGLLEGFLETAEVRETLISFGNIETVIWD
jgi:hypothetical protein